MDAQAYTVEIEIGKLTVGLTSQIDASISAKGEDVHDLGIVCMIYPIGIGLTPYYGVNDLWCKGATELAHIGRVYVTMQDAWYVGAAVYGYELAAKGISVAVFKENLFADAG